MYIILIITQLIHLHRYAQQDGLRKSYIKIKLDKYSGIIDALERI